MLTCRIRLKPGQVVVGDPIDVVTGASLDRQTDIQLDGPLPLPWYRHYDSSKANMPGSLGWGQFHEYDRRIVFDLDGLRYVTPTGDVIGFPALTTDGQTALAGGVTLRRVSARQFTIHEQGEPLATYDIQSSGTFAPLTRLQSEDAQIAFAYDSHGTLSAITDSLGRTIRAEHDTFGRLARLTLKDGTKAKRLAEYQYDSAGNLVHVTDPYGNRIQSRFDSHHRQILRVDRRGYVFQFEYDSQSRCIRAGGHDGTDEVRLKYNPDLRMTVVTRTGGGDWTYFYDDTNTVTRILAPDGGMVQYNRDESGRMAEEVDPLGNITRRLFNAAGSMTGTIDPLGQFHSPDDDNPGPPAHHVPTSAAEWDWGDLFLSEPESPSPIREIDDFGMVYRERFPDEAQRRWVYDANGNVTKYTDREDRTTTLEYVSWNLLAAATNPLGGRVRYRYGPHQLVTACLDAGNTLSEYEYDSCERLTEVRRHGIVKERYQYDVAGNLTAKFDADGKRMLTLESGRANLPLVKRLESGEVQEFEYDDEGRYLVVKTQSGAVTFAYDEFGRRVRDERDGLGVKHQFGPFADSHSVILGRFPVRIVWSSTTEFEIIDPIGGRHTVQLNMSNSVERRFANGTSEVSTYDPEGRCRARIHSGLSSEWSRQFRYSPEGDLLSVQDSQSGETTFRYDTVHRLTGLQRPGKPFEALDLDLAGNLLRMPGLNAVRLLDGNRLSAANGERFEYNRRNHIAVRSQGTSETRYHYNSLDQLIRVERDGQPDWTAAYDALGRRVWKAWGDGQRVEYFWDTDRLIAERDQAGRVRVYVYADAFAMVPFLFVEYASIETDPTQGKRYYVFSDQIGCPTRVEDDHGDIVWSAVIDPYGRARLSSENCIDYHFRFPGHWFDAETGLHYNRFRYYDPVLGRYLQSDPIGLGGGLNLYGYCDGNPLVRVDMLGLNCPGKKPDPRRKEGSPDQEEGPTTPKVKIENRKKGETAVDAAQRKAKEIVKDSTERGEELPVVVTVVRDKKSGKTYTATSGGAPLLPEQAHPRTGMPSEGQYQAKPGESRRVVEGHNKRPVGNCSEPKAIDAALKDGARKKDLEVATVAVAPNRGKGPTGTPTPCCPNCQVTTRGVDKVQTD